MIIFYKKWKNNNKIQLTKNKMKLTKNKMDLNNQKLTNHPPADV